MSPFVRRRQALVLALAGVAAGAGRAAGQQNTRPAIGFLSSRSARDSEEVLAAYRAGLAEAGYAEGRNIAIEYRWADGERARLPALAAELVRAKVRVISAVAETLPAARAATSSIPIVFSTGEDPVAAKFVASLGHPEGNVTGATFFTALLAPKRLQLLREVMPRGGRIGLLVNLASPQGRRQAKDVQEAAGTLGADVVVVSASSDQALAAAFGELLEKRADALLVAADPFFDSRRDEIVKLVLEHRLPAMYQSRDYAHAGGLMSYGASITDLYRQVGLYTGRILGGARPADLPVVQPARFEFVINLKTARALGLSLPATLTGRADQVLE